LAVISRSPPGQRQLIWEYTSLFVEALEEESFEDDEDMLQYLNEDTKDG
jgi:hypothetical protein